MLRLLRWWEIVVLLLIIVGIVTRARADPLRKARLSEPRAAWLPSEDWLAWFYFFVWGAFLRRLQGRHSRSPRRVRVMFSSVRRCPWGQAAGVPAAARLSL